MPKQTWRSPLIQLWILSPSVQRSITFLVSRTLTIIGPFSWAPQENVFSSCFISQKREIFVLRRQSEMAFIVDSVFVLGTSCHFVIGWINFVSVSVTLPASPSTHTWMEDVQLQSMWCEEPLRTSESRSFPPESCLIQLCVRFSEL